MPEDFGYCWRTVRLYCPAAPTFLAREWVQTAYKQLLAARRWGFMRVQITLPVLATDRELVLPGDFASFRVVVDQARQVRIPFTYSLDQLAAADPGGTARGQVGALVATTPSTAPATAGRARYQVYPSGSPATLTAIYHRQGDRLVDGEVFSGVLADGAEVLVCGALAQAALWPGTADLSNPYFNATLAQAKTSEFKYGVQMLSLRDDEQYPDDLWNSWPEADCGGLSGSDPRATDACVC
jgi:hypothetical protein